MIYTKEITIPANTLVTSPYNDTLKVVDGVITEVNILFPSGCRGLVGVRIYDYKHIVWPSNPDAWIIADNETVEWMDDYTMAGLPNTLTLEGYNNDDSFEHTIYFRFVVIEPAKANVLQKLLAIWQG